MPAHRRLIARSGARRGAAEARAGFVLTAEQARRVMVAAQGLDRRPRARATKTSVLESIRRMGALQIDTIHVVARSPYLVLWSRIGDYRPDWLDELLAERRLFEYWAHEASFLPIEDYALFRHRMIDPGEMGWKYSHDWMRRNADVVERVLEAIRVGGAVRSADFERKSGKSGGWWGWKPEKRALELLFTAGHLMVARRDRFQRVYDLRERVHPDWRDDDAPSAGAAYCELVCKAATALGVATQRWLADYYRMSRASTAQAVEILRSEGRLVDVHVDGWPEPAYAGTGNVPLLERALAGGLKASLTTVLSPFDPLVWDRSRALAVFGFDYRLECYTPAPKRAWGYFVLPILRRGRLAGRLDAKAHRAKGMFEVIRLYLEDGVRPTRALAADVGGALTRLARWHGTPDVVIRRTSPAGFGALLRQKIRGAR